MQQASKTIQAGFNDPVGDQEICTSTDEQLDLLGKLYFSHLILQITSSFPFESIGAPDRAPLSGTQAVG